MHVLNAVMPDRAWRLRTGEQRPRDLVSTELGNVRKGVEKSSLRGLVEPNDRARDEDA